MLCTCCRARQWRGSRTLRSRRGTVRQQTGRTLAGHMAKICRCRCTRRPLRHGAADPRLSVKTCPGCPQNSALPVRHTPLEATTLTSSCSHLCQGVDSMQHACPWSRVAWALEAQQSACDARQKSAPATPQAEAVEAATRASRPLSASNTGRRQLVEVVAPGKENGHATAAHPPETMTSAPNPAMHPHSRVRAAGWLAPALPMSPWSKCYS